MASGGSQTSSRSGDAATEPGRDRGRRMTGWQIAKRVLPNDVMLVVTDGQAGKKSVGITPFDLALRFIAEDAGQTGPGRDLRRCERQAA